MSEKSKITNFNQLSLEEQKKVIKGNPIQQRIRRQINFLKSLQQDIKRIPVKEERVASLLANLNAIDELEEEWNKNSDYGWLFK